MSTSSHLILLAALDLDGTLLNSNGEVSPRTQKVLSEAFDRGVVVIPATGRPLASLPPVVAKQPWVHYALTSNGAAVWDLGGDPLGCVYSRYANAAEHETSQPECIVRRCFPRWKKARGGLRGVPGPARRAERLQRRARSPRHGAAALFRRAVRPSGGGEGDRGHPAQRWPLHHPAGPERVDEPPRPRGGEVLHVLPLGERGAAVSAPLYGHRGRRGGAGGRRTTSKSPPPE